LTLCKAGEEALSYLDSGGPPNGWKQRTLAASQAAAQQHGDILIQIAPAVQNLVEAVQTIQK